MSLFAAAVTPLSHASPGIADLEVDRRMHDDVAVAGEHVGAHVEVVVEEVFVDFEHGRIRLALLVVGRIVDDGVLRVTVGVEIVHELRGADALLRRAADCSRRAGACRRATRRRRRRRPDDCHSRSRRSRCCRPSRGAGRNRSDRPSRAPASASSRGRSAARPRSHFVRDWLDR